MDRIKLKIVTPQKIYLSGEFEMVTLPAEKGELALLKDHVPLLANLKAGLICTYLNNNIKDHIIINSGVLNFANNEAIILAEEIIDKAKYNKEFFSTEITNLQNKISSDLKSGNDITLNQNQDKLNNLIKIKALLD